LLAVADVALNPMRTGSGTNLKMLDYFAAGVPVLSTAFGARGLQVSAGTHYAMIDDGGLAASLEALLASPPETRSRMVAAARALVEQRYAWSTIAQTFVDELQATKPAASGRHEVQ
jgi:glycosyltransferase involved in cell wall biosynthesis